MSKDWNDTKDPPKASLNQQPPRLMSSMRSESRHRTLPTSWWPLFSFLLLLRIHPVSRSFFCSSSDYMGVEPEKTNDNRRPVSLLFGGDQGFFLWVDYAEERGEKMLSSAASTTASIMSYKSSSSPLYSLSSFQKHLLLLCCVCKNMVSDRWEDCVKSSLRVQS